MMNHQFRALENIYLLFFAVICGVQTDEQKRFKPFSTKRTDVEAFDYFRDELHFDDAVRYCESLEGEIYPQKLGGEVTKKLKSLNTVFWFWAVPITSNDSHQTTTCRTVKYLLMGDSVASSNVSRTRNRYPFLCRIPFSENNETSCSKGYMTLRSGRCLDVNECDGDPCRGYHSICKNLPGSFRCQCQKGMQGSGLDACGYLLTFYQRVDAGVVTAVSGPRNRKRVIEQQLLRAISANGISKIIVKDITNDDGRPQSKLLYYDVYAKFKLFNARRFQARIRHQSQDSSWLAKFGTPQPFSGWCLPDIRKTPEVYLQFPKSKPGTFAKSVEKCPGTEKSKAEVLCTIKSIDNSNMTYFNYATFKKYNCTMATSMNTLPQQTTSETTPFVATIEQTSIDRHFQQTTSETTPLETTTEVVTTSVIATTKGLVANFSDAEWRTQKPKKSEYQTSSFEDLLGNFLKQLESNATFRASKAAFNLGRNLLLNTISSLESDSSAKVSSKAMGHATGMLDWLIENPGSIKSTKEEKTNLVLSFERLPAKVNLTREAHYSVETKMISLQVKQVAMENATTEIKLETKASNLTSYDFQTKASLPTEVAGMINETSNSSKHFNAGFLIYKNTSLFSVDKSQFDGAELPQVLSVTVPGDSIRNLSKPFWYQMATSNDGKKKVLRHFHCGFLNETTGNWSTQGCQYIPNSNPPNCTCNHLTNFALLVKNVEMLDDFALGIFGKIACSISVACLIWTLGCYLSSRDLRRVQVNQIHIHMCFTLLISYLAFLLGAERTENKKGCMAVAAILHFFLLSTWGWMTVEAITMYRKLVRVFGKTKENYVRKCAAAVYSTCIVIVVMTITITVYEYDNKYMTTWQSDMKNRELFNSFYVSERLCWLRGVPLFVSFLGPVAISIVISYICFTRITKAITCDRRKVKSSRRETKLDEIKKYLARAGAISAVMGLTWIFAIPLAISDDQLSSIIFSWLFSIFNALQGFSIFIFFCVKRSEIRAVWMSVIRNSSYGRSRKTADAPYSPTHSKSYGVTQLNSVTGDLMIRKL